MMSSPGLQPGVCFKVERIIGYTGGGGGNSDMKCYKVIWAPTWVSSANLVGCQDLIDQFFEEEKSSAERIQSSTDGCDNDHTTGVLLDSDVSTDDAISGTVSTKIDDHDGIDTDIVNESGCEDMKSLRKKPNQQHEIIHQLKHVHKQQPQNKELQVHPRVSSFSVVIKQEGNDTPSEIHHAEVDSAKDSMLRADDWTARSLENQHEDIPVTMVPRYVSQREKDIENITNTSDTCSKGHSEYGRSPSGQYFSIYPDPNNTLRKGETFTMLLNEDITHNSDPKVTPPPPPPPPPPTLSVDTICKYCNKKFSNKCNLKRHIMTHTGEKPHVCTVCGKAFSNIQYLTHHMRTHTGEKPYQCSFCDKSFSQRSTLTGHERLHSGERPYKCLICKRTFVDNSGLRSHLKRIHNDVVS